MFKKENTIEYLLGSKQPNTLPTKPFDSLVCEFLEIFSKKLDLIKNIKNYPDLKTLSFWCRKGNINSLKKKYFSEESRLGLGMIFHITPSNIPTNFAYSLIFGLLTGNSNIVKVPSNKFYEVDIICSVINLILKNKKFRKIKDRILIFRYKNNDSLTREISLKCDARIIWGGDKTINAIRKFELNERAREITFSDRYSICVINLNKLPLNDLSIYKKLALDFYNDTYLVDQNACSSPHLIIWYGKNNNEKKKRFWKNVLDVVKLKYDLSERLAIEKYYELCSQLSKSNNIKSEIRYENLIYTLNLKSLISDMDNFRGKGGFFYEFNTSKMNDVAKIVNKKYQTLTYFGFNKNFFRDFLFDNSLKGIDRVVPIGKALDIGLIWDGYDLNKFLTRIIDIK